MSTINRFRRRVHPWAYPILFGMLCVVTLVQFILPAIAQTTIGAPISTIDAMPWLTLGLQGLGVVIMVAVMWFVYGHVKDQNARNAFLNIAGQALSFGLNTVANATKDKTLSVNVGSSVVANALNFLQTYGPQAMARFGINEKDAVKMLWSRLPSVDGTVTDATFDNIIAASKGQVPATPADIMAQVPALAAAILAQLKNQPDAAPIVNPQPPAPIPPPPSPKAAGSEGAG